MTCLFISWLSLTTLHLLLSPAYYSIMALQPLQLPTTDHGWLYICSYQLYNSAYLVPCQINMTYLFSLNDDPAHPFDSSSTLPTSNSRRPPTSSQLDAPPDSQINHQLIAPLTSTMGSVLYPMSYGALPPLITTNACLYSSTMTSIEQAMTHKLIEIEAMIQQFPKVPTPLKKI